MYYLWHQQRAIFVFNRLLLWRPKNRIAKRVIITVTNVHILKWHKCYAETIDLMVMELILVMKLVFYVKSICYVHHFLLEVSIERWHVCVRAWVRESERAWEHESVIAWESTSVCECDCVYVYILLFVYNSYIFYVILFGI